MVRRLNDRRWGGGKLGRVGAAGIAVLVGAGAAGAGTVSQFDLRDHPVTGDVPTRLGLRMGNIFTTIGGPAVDTAFSMNTFSNTVLTVSTVGSDLMINISGTLYGGEVAGAGYGYGEGAYAFNFDYRVNVAPLDEGWVVTDLSPSNNGTLTALGDNAGVPNGTVFSFSDKGDGAPSFVMLRDGHQLTAMQQIALGNPWVGRGWYMIPGVQGGAQDSLFIATVVPLPMPAMLVGVGLLGIAAQRRRRS